MARIQFDRKYRPQIESGEYKVETRDGRLVRIVCWDRNGDYPIMALATEANGHESYISYLSNGRMTFHNQEFPTDLFIITPEEELTEFEDRIRQVCEEAVTEAAVFPDRTSEDFAKTHSAKLLSLARKELIEEQYTSDPRKTDLYKLGKAEGLEYLPRWKQIQKDDNAIVRIPHVGTNMLGERMLYIGENAISISCLMKLPGFKEDDSHD